jgi:hypothetical protein
MTHSMWNLANMMGLLLELWVWLICECVDSKGFEMRPTRVDSSALFFFFFLECVDISALDLNIIQAKRGAKVTISNKNS